MTDEEITVTIREGAPPRFSAESMRALKKATGRTMTEIEEGDDEADRLQVLAFAELFRRAARLGHLPDAATLWEQAGTAMIEFESAGPMDPLGDGSSPTSPPSAPTGT